ncbi:hypothetical protein [Levilactobacillus phage ENFP1]|nr:hypothetical protein [Levilactobacillus phage ENFP1]
MNSYRLWDKVDYMYVDIENAVMSLDGSRIWWGNVDSGDIIYEDDLENYKLEQSSGYTDKWNNQVFEGDIVEVYYVGNEEYTGLAKVSFKDGSFQLSGKIMEKIFADNLLFGYPEDYSTDLWGKKVEVVGNINETPNLLERLNE